MMSLLQAELEKRNKSYPIEKTICLGQCGFGPTVRIAPGGEFFLGAKKDRVEEIADWIEQEMSKDD